MIDVKPACRGLIDVLAGVADDQLTDPTPCTDYTVGDLLDHLSEVAQGFAGLARGDGAEHAVTHLVGDWRESLTEQLRDLGRAWDAPAAWRGSATVSGLELPNEVWGRIALTEVVMHGWDLATATGQPFDLPEETVRACLEHVAEFVPNAPIPQLWGPAVQVPGDAPLLERVVAITGRTPAAAQQALPGRTSRS